MTNYSKHKHTGTENPVREGETLVKVWFRSGFNGPCNGWTWGWEKSSGPDKITDYAVSPPRFVDWSKPLVTNMGTAGVVIGGPDSAGDYRVGGDFGDIFRQRWFNADGSHFSGDDPHIYVRNAPEAADKPGDAWEKTTHISVDYGPMRPAIAALEAGLAELDAERDRITRAMRILRGEG